LLVTWGGILPTRGLGEQIDLEDGQSGARSLVLQSSRVLARLLTEESAPMGFERQGLYRDHNLGLLRETPTNNSSESDKGRVHRERQAATSSPTCRVSADGGLPLLGVGPLRGGPCVHIVLDTYAMRRRKRSCSERHTVMLRERREAGPRDGAVRTRVPH